MYKIDRSEDGGSNNRKLGQTLFRIVFFLKIFDKERNILTIPGNYGFKKQD